MLTIGEKFPFFSVTATVSTTKDKEFETITDESYADKWKLHFFWPKDFAFVCPTGIAGFAKLNTDFRGTGNSQKDGSAEDAVVVDRATGETGCVRSSEGL